MKRFCAAAAGAAAVDLIDRLADDGLQDVDLLAALSDGARLDASRAGVKILLPDGSSDPGGELDAALDGAEAVFVITGDSAGMCLDRAELVASAARSRGAIVAVFFIDSGSSVPGDVDEVRAQSLIALRESSDAIMYIPMMAPDASYRCLRDCISGIVGMVERPGLANVSVADLRKMLDGAGGTVIGVGEASGEDAAVMAARRALKSRTLDRSLVGACRAMFCITSGPGTTRSELEEAGGVIASAVDDDVRGLLWGHTVDSGLGDRVRIVIAASDFDEMKGPRNEMRSQVIGYLDREGYRYDCSEPDRIRCGFNLACRLSEVNMVLHFYNHGYRAAGYCPLKVTQEFRPEVMKFLTMANCGMINGNFDFDLGDGEISYRTFTCYEDMLVLSDAVIDRSFGIVCSMFEEYGNGLVDVMMGYKDAETAIGEIESK